MAELAYAGDLKSLGEILTGSSPVPGTKTSKKSSARVSVGARADDFGKPHDDLEGGHDDCGDSLGGGDNGGDGDAEPPLDAVSYTHLTLPTIYSV